VRTARGRSASSTRWLERQLNDPYVRAAKLAGWRSRAAYKLIELDERFKLLRPGLRVLDLGAAPGGWTQVAAQRCPGGRVLAVDLLAMDPVPGAGFLQLDLREAGAAARIQAALAGPADLVLSDMAPPASGHKATDHLRVVALVEAAAELALDVLAPDGAFVAKVWQGGTEGALLDRLKRAFAQARHAKPKASRAESAEMYLVAQGFRGRPS
jgi:23S rRNA (uridine2552-2'-O)-methyltransferase